MSQALFEYKGRRPVRVDGKARREALLEATLAIIISDGIRGVRHRAVAEKAQVPLAATTYYFDDIFDLIHDAFVFYSEKILKDVNSLEEKSFALFEQAAAGLSRQQRIDRVTDFAVEYVKEQVLLSDYRVIEQTFRTQAMRDPAMAELMNAMESRHIESIERFMNKLDLSNVSARARLFFYTMIRSEYEVLAGLVNIEQACEQLRKNFALIFAE